MSTTQSTSTQYSLDSLTDAAGSYAAESHADFDLEAVASQWLAEINEQLPEGATLTASGILYYSDDVDYDALNLSEIVDSVDLSALLKTNDAVTASVTIDDFDCNAFTLTVGEDYELGDTTTAHTFKEIDGEEEIADFDQAQFFADVDAALAPSWKRVGDFTDINGTTFACKVVPA